MRIGEVLGKMDGRFIRFLVQATFKLNHMFNSGQMSSKIKRLQQLIPLVKINLFYFKVLLLMDQEI
jgi:hypothetical protein